MLLILVKTKSGEYDRCVIHEEMVATLSLTASSIQLNDTQSDLEDSNHRQSLATVRKSMQDQLHPTTHRCDCAIELFNSQTSWKPYKWTLDSHVFSCLMYTATVSDSFRRGILSTLMAKTHVWPSADVDATPHLQIEAKLRWPQRLKLDKAWSDKTMTMVREREELENVMAWLSTLGGAYSALGDDYSHCARVAGKISIQQLKIALRLSDPITVAKCKVFFAMSLIQQGYMKQAKRIIKEQFAFATSFHPALRDGRLVNMCKGVWSRLRYLQSLSRTHENRK